MDNDILTAILSIISAVIGGAIAIIGNVIAQKLVIKKEKQLWSNEKKLNLYADLIAILSSIEIRISAFYDNPAESVQTEVSKEYVESKLKELVSFVEENLGMFTIFVPQEINSKIIHLWGDIFSIIKCEEKQHIYAENLEDSEMFKVWKKAQEIVGDLKKELIV